MSLTFKSLTTLTESVAVDDQSRILFQNGGGEFYNGRFSTLRSYFTADVNARVDQLVEDLANGEAGGGPSIWPTPRTLTLTGPVTGSVDWDGSSNVSMAVTVPAGALTIANVSGLAANLADLAQVDDENLALVSDLIDGKSDIGHTHSTTEAAATASDYAQIPLGLSQAAFGGDGGTSVGLTVNASSNNLLQLVGGPDALSFRARTNGGWSPQRSVFHSGNFNPAEYARLDGAIFTGAVQVRTRLHILSAAGVNRIVLQPGGDDTILRGYTTTGATQGELRLGPDDRLTYNTRVIYHSGNMDATTIMHHGDGLDEVFVDAPVAYGNSQDWNALPYGRAMMAPGAPNAPTNTGEWYVETIQQGPGASIQRTYGAVSSEHWYRSKLNNGNWTEWRRVWDSTTFSSSGYLRTGDYGVGSESITVNDIDGLVANGFYQYTGVQAPTSDILWHIVHDGKSLVGRTQTATSTAGKYYRVFNSPSWGPWINLSGSGGTGKWDTLSAQAHGFEGAPPQVADFNAPNLEGLSLFTAPDNASNRPSASSGTMMTVHLQTGTGSVVAKAQMGLLAKATDQSPELYLRSLLSSSTYGAWAKVYTDKNLDMAPYWRQQANIGSNVDLNNVQASGFYQQLIDSNATLALNYPQTAAGLLRVYAPTSGYVWQEYIPRNGLGTWRRVYYSGAWLPWSRSITTTTGAADFGGSVAVRSIDSSSNANVWLRDNNNLNQGVLYWDAATDSVRLRRYNAAGNDAEGELQITATGATFTGTMSATRFTGQEITADRFVSQTGSAGMKYQVGNDASLWDVDVSNTLAVRGMQDSTQGAIQFGTGTTLARDGNYLTANTEMKAVAFIQTSDARLKSEIEPLPYTGRLNPVTYTLTESGTRQIGFLAQEVEALYPTTVFRSVKKKGLLAGKEVLSLAHDHLIAVVSAQANQLEDEVVALNAQVAQLTALVDRLLAERS